MSFSLLNTAALAALELTLNNLLKLDQTSLSKLHSLAGSVIAINVSSPALSIFLTPHQQGINLSLHYEGKADASINGSISALISLMASPSDKQDFYQSDIEVSGSLELLQQLQKILSGLKLDWEFYLSKYIGDIPTQAIADRLESTKKLTQKASLSIVADIEEYIHEEKMLFPSNLELEQFYNSISKLKLKIDRVSAKIEHL